MKPADATGRFVPFSIPPTRIRECEPGDEDRLVLIRYTVEANGERSQNYALVSGEALSDLNATLELQKQLVGIQYTIDERPLPILRKLRMAAVCADHGVVLDKLFCPGCGKLSEVPFLDEEVTR